MPARSSTECERMLAIIRRECPGLVPPDPLDPGQVAPEVTLDGPVVAELFTTAALFAAGLLDAGGRPRGDAVVWSDGDSELVVVVAEVRVRLVHGALAVTIPVRCEEIGAADTHVTFAAGSPERPAGLLVATEMRPRGPRLIVDRWGQALIAFAWKLVLDVAAHVAFAAGGDKDGERLVPAVLTTDGKGLTIRPQARHDFDRVLRP
jgi:hypothetical protein